MIEIPTDRLWTAEEIEAFRPVVEGWNHNDMVSFHNKIDPDQMANESIRYALTTNLTAFHKVYTAKIQELLLANRPATLQGKMPEYL